MSSSFPLYDNLINDVETSVDLKTKEKDEFMSLIKTIDDNTAELIYALIRVYQLENNENNISTFTVPYDGKFIDNEIKFDLNELPIKLKHILFKFLKLHCNVVK
jgi:hypothetical protein